ncbi:type II secretion system protein N [Pseudomonas indica]|uniref:type II secretion system protein N n=1 Tax=Pseudomonas indica TaxID=137658 RepID=UPI000BD9D057|nr:type II secretion system protein N [Pseudomonas indica]MBU3057333.1 hypothetical protein [Pseudomonas indica]PAU55951.1 hypothetical protein BZL42_18215 [Pseudomonas indica]
MIDTRSNITTTFVGVIPLPFAGAPRWLQQHAPKLVGAALIFAMCVSLAWQTAGWIRLMRAPTQTVTTDTPVIHSAPVLERLEPLFGPSNAVAGNAPPPATNLRLTLHGSFVHADPKRSSAIIQSEGGKPQRYRVGAELEGGIRLHAVYRDRVEIERNGRLETLPFPAARSGSGPTNYLMEESFDHTGQMDMLEQEDAELLRERMEALREQMEAAGSAPEDHPEETSPPEDMPSDSDTEQPMESD